MSNRFDVRIKNYVLQKANYKCQYCGKELAPEIAQIDHIVPLSKGGQNEINNLVACCPSCNQKKHDKSLQVFAVTIGGALLGNLVFPGVGGAIVGGVIGGMIGANSNKGEDNEN